MTSTTQHDSFRVWWEEYKSKMGKAYVEVQPRVRTLPKVQEANKSVALEAREQVQLA